MVSASGSALVELPAATQARSAVTRMPSASCPSAVTSSAVTAALSTASPPFHSPPNITR